MNHVPSSLPPNAIAPCFEPTISMACVPVSASCRYENSELVRDWLVMCALAGSGVPLNSDLQQSGVTAFNKLVLGLQDGLVQLDYAPIDRTTLDIPAGDHPHYMQALLYWSSRLGCTTSVLVEAHARLGKSPTAANVRRATCRIKKEERLARAGRGDGQNTHGTAETMPVFQATTAS